MEPTDVFEVVGAYGDAGGIGFGLRFNDRLGRRRRAKYGAGGIDFALGLRFGER